MLNKLKILEYKYHYETYIQTEKQQCLCSFQCSLSASFHFHSFFSLSELKEKINALQIAIVNKQFRNIKHTHYLLLSNIRKTKSCSNKKNQI